MNVARALDRAASSFAILNFPKVGLVPDWPDWMLGNPRGMSEEQLQSSDAFRKIPIVHAIVTQVANDCASLPVRFYQGEVSPEREIERKFRNVVDVFSGANSRDTGHQFKLNLYGDLKLHPDTFIYLERGRGAPRSRPPYAIWTLDPTMVKIVPARNREVEEYVWYGAGEPQSIAPWNIIHIRHYNPKDELTGANWVEAAREEWMAAWFLVKVMRQFFARGGISPGTWALDGNHNKPLTGELIKRLQIEYQRRFQNVPDSLWKMIVVDGMKQIEKGQTISEMKLDDMTTLINANLCRAAGVPPWKMGIKEAGSSGLDQGSSGATSDEGYWRSTIGNPVRLFDAVMNERFCPLFDDDIIMKTDMEGVPALQAARLELLKGAVIAAEDAVVSVNEARSWVGLEETGREEDDLPRQRPTASDLLAQEEARAQGQGGEADPPEAEDDAGSEGSVERDAAARRTFASREQRAERMRRRQDTRLKREERRLARLWEQIRDHQTERALENMREQERRGFSSMAERIPIDPDRLYPDLTVEERAALERTLEAIMEKAAEYAADEIGTQIALETYAASVASYIRQRVDRMIVNVSATDRDGLREKIAKAVTEGKQWHEVQKLVVDFFDGRRANSMTIARTETVGPYNRAQMDAWKAGGVRRKWWLNVDDEATRATHRIAGIEFGEDRSIGINEPFIVGGRACMVPGETGDPGEDCNCRCMSMADLSDFEEQLARGLDLERRRQPWVNRLRARVLPPGHSPDLILTNGKNGVHV